MSVVYNLNNIPGFKELLLNDQASNYLLKKESLSKNNVKYSIIQYDKSMLAIDLVPTIGVLRSVIVNEQKRVVGFSPPKSLSYDAFVGLYPEKTPEIAVEEFIEGTMINVFWDQSSGLGGGWEVATRNTVGADVRFYKNNPNAKIFREMFLEAVTVCGLDLNLLNPSLCYSFVLQHPENRIVTPFDKPALYFIEGYEIVTVADGSTLIYVFKGEQTPWLNTDVKTPKVFDDWVTYDDIKRKYVDNTSYTTQGIIIRNRTTNERTKIRNPEYEYVRRLKGNEPKAQYHYLCLRQQESGKIAEYLKIYPEHKREFSLTRERLHQFTDQLFQNYIECYIKKLKPLKEYPDNYRTHMFHIHQKYLNELKGQNAYVTNTEVIKYVNKIHPTLQMYSINYSLRKKRVDTIKSDELVNTVFN
jgi:hypothetical protein